MAIIRRFSRMCRADLNGVLDQLEDKGLLLKQFLRDMEAELARKEARLRQLAAAHDQARTDRDARDRERARLDQDLTVAVEKDRDDIARFLIRRIKQQERVQDQVARRMASLEQESAELGRLVEEQRLRYEQLQLQAREYLRRTENDRKEAVFASAVPDPFPGEPSDEEVELELIRAKERVKGGVRS